MNLNFLAMPFSDAASSIRPLYSAAVEEKPFAASEELAAPLTGCGFVFLPAAE